MKIFTSLTLEKSLPWLLIIAGVIGLLCAGIISYEKIQLLKNPAYEVPCNLDPIISCGSVMQSNQAEAFGFPNPFIGLVAYPVVITAGVIMLSGVRLKRWFMLGLQAGAFLGVLFVHWLFIQSVWHIQALCPWCMIVWTVTITIFWYVTLYNLRQGHIRLPEALQTFVQKHHLDILFLWLLAIAALILHHFWYFYGPKLGF